MWKIKCISALIINTTFCKMIASLIEVDNLKAIGNE